MRTPLTPILLFFLAIAGCSVTAAGGDRVTVTRDEANNLFRIEVNGKLFTEYHYDTYPRPILYPVLGPGDVPMTRNYPMKKGVKGEAKDHHHHKSLWFCHGEVKSSNIDYVANYWHERGKNVDKMVLKKVIQAKSGDVGVLETLNEWGTAKGDKVCRDTRKLTFHVLDDGTRMIDYDLTVTASEGDLTFMDTKEGSMAIRTHPNLRLKPAKKGVNQPLGTAVNSEGDTGKSLWGKRAEWVDYWGTIDGKKVGIAIMDHPSNLRHPTTWHARDYGLIAANPFGISYFEKKKKGAGNFTIKRGDSRSFRYRFVFHKGDAKAGRIKERFSKYAKVK